MHFLMMVMRMFVPGQGTVCKTQGMHVIQLIAVALCVLTRHISLQGRRNTRVKEIALQDMVLQQVCSSTESAPAKPRQAGML